MKYCLWAFLLVMGLGASAQSDSLKKGGFKKELLFTGGSVQASFGSGFTLLGASPVLGYSINRFIDAGIALNYTYASQRTQFRGEKIRQSVYGGGVFTRLFPVRFLFAQGQIEHNFIRQKYIVSGSPDTKYKAAATSYLVGAGYTTGRMAGNTNAYGYISLSVDLGNDPDSPYKDNQGNRTPIIRAGVNIPLFQGGRTFQDVNDYYQPRRRNNW